MGAGAAWTEDLVLSVHLNVLAPAREASRAPVAWLGLGLGLALGLGLGLRLE